MVMFRQFTVEVASHVRPVPCQHKATTANATVVFLPCRAPSHPQPVWAWSSSVTDKLPCCSPLPQPAAMLLLFTSSSTCLQLHGTLT
jgi:hypothetical protein